MTAWPRFDRILQRALAMSDAQRPAFLEQICGTDSALRQSLDEYLALSTRAETFLAAPIVEQLGVSRNRPRAHLGSTTGRVLGPFTILGKLGTGGMGSVYLARRTGNGDHHRVAIKVIHGTPCQCSRRQRLRREIGVLSRLDHPDVVKIVDVYGDDKRRPFFAMEWIRGERIDDYCRRNQLSVPQRVALVLRVCAAVRHVHRRRVVHHDLKPSNILVAENGKPTLLDFGVARPLDEPDRDDRCGCRLMTPSYASPEQILTGLVSTAADVYTLGVLLYELLTGQLPRNLQAKSFDQLSQSFARPPAPPSEIVRAGHGVEDGAGRSPSPIPRRHKLLDAIVLKALRRDVARRYVSVRQLANDLGGYLMHTQRSAKESGIGP